MIPAEHQELITAAVDGELSAPEVRALRRVLDHSAEARSLYAKLKVDRDRMRDLSQVAPPPDLRAKILARIASATPAPPAKPIRIAQPARSTNIHTRTAPAPTRRFATWIPVAVAASLLLCVTAASFAFFNSQSDERPHAAKQPWSNALPAPVEIPTTVPSLTAPPRETRHDPASVVRVDVSPVPPLPPPHPVVPEAVALAPEPRPAYHDLLGSRPLPKIAPFEFAQLRVPFLRTIVELERDDIRQELIDELGRDHPSAFRLDLFVRDTARGVDVFQSAAKATGLAVFSDAATVEKLSKKQAHSVVVYTECMTAGELAQLFAKIGAEDNKFSPRVCDSLHVTPVARADENELKLVLGMDAGLFKRPRVGSHGTGLERAPLDKNGEPKSVSAGTIDSVTNALTNPPGKAPEKPAVLLTWQAAQGATRTLPTQSAELKHFLARRGDRKPSAVPVIIVIRPIG